MIGSNCAMIIETVVIKRILVALATRSENWLVTRVQTETTVNAVARRIEIS